jgi:ATP-dependent protease ClpP protease subunit
MAKKKAPEVDFLELVSQVHNYDLNPFTREIYLHSHYSSGHSDEEGGIEYRMATQFVKNLHLLDQNNHENILVHLQSPGGDWIHGMAMYDAIEAANSCVNILAYGEVSSMSSILLQAAHRRIMMPSCEFMIHRGFLSLEGVATTVQTNAAWNKKTDMTMLQIYASRAVSGPFFRLKDMTEGDVIKFIDQKIRKLGDWNLSAEEAVYYGLADGVLGCAGFESLEKIRKC